MTKSDDDTSGKITASEKKLSSQKKLSSGKKVSPIKSSSTKTTESTSTSIKESEKKEKAKEEKKNSLPENDKDIEVPSTGKPKSSRKRISFGSKQFEIQKPSKTLLLIWLLVSAELVFDLTTSAIAFVAFVREPEDCCGEIINKGEIPIYLTSAFFGLIVLELLCLLRAIKLTLRPNLSIQDDETKSSCCRWSNWGPKFYVWLVNFLTVINPYFGLVIAFLLIYQSDKTEALTIMVLEGVTVILHFLSVYLEKNVKSRIMKVLHGSIILPLVATLAINLWYLNQGGVCYDTSKKTFWYTLIHICKFSFRIL